MHKLQCCKKYIQEIHCNIVHFKYMLDNIPKWGQKDNENVAQKEDLYRNLVQNTVQRVFETLIKYTHGDSSAC